MRALYPDIGLYAVKVLCRLFWQSQDARLTPPCRSGTDSEAISIRRSCETSSSSPQDKPIERRIC